MVGGGNEFVWSHNLLIQGQSFLGLILKKMTIYITPNIKLLLYITKFLLIFIFVNVALDWNSWNKKIKKYIIYAVK